MLHKSMNFFGAVLLILLALLIGWIGVATLQSPSEVRFPPSPTLTPAPPHAIVSNHLEWHEVWRRTVGASYGAPEAGTSIMAVSGHILVMPIMGPDVTQLTAFDVHNVQTVWTLLVFIDRAGPPIEVDTLYADSTLVYFAVPPRIFAARLSDGSPLWKTGDLRTHTGYFIYPEIKDKTLQVYSDEVNLYNLQADTGQIKSVQKYPDGFLFEVSTSDYFTTPEDLTCTDASTAQQRWRVATSGSVRRWPVFFHPDLMIFEAGRNAGATLTAVNADSGQVLWKTPADIASNFVIEGNAVYSISVAGVLTTRAVKDGHETGRLTFSGGRLDVDHASQYWVTADDSRMFVYFGDSQELIALARD